MHDPGFNVSEVALKAADVSSNGLPDKRIHRCIINCVASDFGVEAAALKAPVRGSQRTAFARQVAMYLAHVGFGFSYDAIGRMFERDRTTVSHACRVVEDRRDDIWFDCRIATLEQICRRAGWQGAIQ